MYAVLKIGNRKTVHYYVRSRLQEVAELKEEIELLKDLRFDAEISGAFEDELLCYDVEIKAAENDLLYWKSLAN